MNRSFDNLTNKQRRQLIRQIEVKKHRWMDRIFKDMAERGIMPRDIYEAAHSGSEEGKKRAEAWLKQEGIHTEDIWEPEDLGAVLMQRERVLYRLRVQIKPEAWNPGNGNVPDTSGN